MTPGGGWLTQKDKSGVALAVMASEEAGTSNREGHATPQEHQVISNFVNHQFPRFSDWLQAGRNQSGLLLLQACC